MLPKPLVEVLQIAEAPARALLAGASALMLAFMWGEMDRVAFNRIRSG